MPTIDDILKDFNADRKGLVNILHRVQEAFGHVPPEAVARVARHLCISENDVFGVLTFYSAFSLTPKGRHVVKVCLGTACHVRGGAQIAEEVSRELSLSPGQTSPDGSFTMETVNCLGCCAIGPVVLIDGDYHGNVTIHRVGTILGGYRQSDKSEVSPHPIEADSRNVGGGQVP